MTLHELVNKKFVTYYHSRKLIRFNDDIKFINESIEIDGRELEFYDIDFNNLIEIKYSLVITYIENMKIINLKNIKKIHGILEISHCGCETIMLTSPITVVECIYIFRNNFLKNLDLSLMTSNKINKLYFAENKNLEKIKFGIFNAQTIYFYGLESLSAIDFNKSFCEYFNVDDDLLKKKFIYTGHMTIKIALLKGTLKNAIRFIEGPIEL